MSSWPYKAIFATAVVLALLIQIITVTPQLHISASINSSLSRVCLLLTMAGCVAGARPLRVRFQAMDMDKTMALKNSEYMADRRAFRIWASAAMMGLASLYSPAIHLTPTVGAITTGVALLVLIPVADRLGGWTRADTAP